MIPQAPTSTEDRALSLLGQGIGPEIVASAVGVSVSRISQLLSDEQFSAQVAELRYKNLSKHNERDSAYDSLEDTLLERLKDCLPFMVRPLELLKAVQIINMAKRRGSSAPDTILAQKEVVNLIMPVQVVQQFTTNINNQVIQAGKQELITVQSGNMNSLLESRKTSKPSGQDHVVPTISERAERIGASK